MSTFIEWIRSEFVPERTEDKFNLLRADLTYYHLHTKSFNTKPTGNIVCYINLSYNKNDLKISSDATLDQIQTYAEMIMQPNEEGHYLLKLTVHTESDIWELFWAEKNSRWILRKHRSIQRMFSWMRNFPKAILNFEESSNYCKTQAKTFLIEFLTMLRSDSDIRLTDTYQSFVLEKLKPINEYLYSEKESLRDPRYIPRCSYKREELFDDDHPLVKIYLKDPPREFMRETVHIRPIKTEEIIYEKAISEGYNFEEETLLVPMEKIERWPLQGVIERAPNLTENRRKLNAINLLSNPEMIHHQRLLDLLSRPNALPEVEPIDVINIKPVFQRDNIESIPQCKAIDKVFGSQDITLIQGPPGTGKTEVICEMIMQIIRKGGRVLLTSPTNVAVDNVLERLFTEKDVRAIRIGHPDRIYNPEIKKLLLSYQVQNWKEMTKINQPFIEDKETEVQRIQHEFFNRLDKENFREIRSMIIDQSNLVCGTCMGVVNMEFSEVSLDQPFDLMIVDEASKATLLEFIVPAVRARKWVLVGDHRQLAPYVSDIELKLYLQNFLETYRIIKRRNSGITKNARKKNRGKADEEGTREYSDFAEFDPKVEAIMKNIRRYHEEFHNLEQDYSEKYLNKILSVFEYRKVESTSFIEMVESSLGSCFHYFWRRVDDSRKAYLPYQHRMPEEIATLLNEKIYDNKFSSSKDAKIHGFRIPLNTNDFVLSPKTPTIWIDTSRCKDQ